MTTKMVDNESGECGVRGERRGLVSRKLLSGGQPHLGPSGGWLCLSNPDREAIISYSMADVNNRLSVDLHVMMGDDAPTLLQRR